jgi:hypothetical protein
MREYETRRALHEKTQAQSTVEDPPENEDVDVDDLIKNWKAHKRPKKMMMYNIIIRQIDVHIASILGTFFG